MTSSSRLHAGGFSLQTIDADLEALFKLPGVEIAGVTTYPSANFERLSRCVEPTPNVASMRSLAGKLREHGVERPEINMASELSSTTIALAAEGGATQIEPGHAFTGTSPYQIFSDAPERQAMIYLSEISHHHGAGASFFGGGLYECIGAVEHTRKALVARSGEPSAKRELCHLAIPPNGVIDFYGRVDPMADGDIRIGDTVIVCTRPQAFFTRAFVVPIEGVQRGEPKVLGVWDVNGFPSPAAPRHVA